MGKLKITLTDLFSIPSAVIYNPDSFKSLSKVEIDSRKVTKGTLFFAIKGEKFDGHNFIGNAIEKGAAALVINKKYVKKFRFIQIPLIAVDDSIKAYGDLAKIWRMKLSAQIISITGSNGKTSTKEILATLLVERFSVVKTEANNNNHIGVPLTIFSADEKCEALVLEQGTNHFGEIAYSAKISSPDHAVITNIGDSHLEFLKNRDGVYKEKSALLKITDERNGIVYLNMDDPVVRKHANEFKNKVTFGFNGKVNVKGKILGYDEPGRTKIQIRFNKEKFEMILPIYGESNAKNFLAASAVALRLGLTQEEIISGTQKLLPVRGRLEVKRFPSAFLIDDTYNSSPISVQSAYQLVQKVKVFKQKLVILGDIFELGGKSILMHKELAHLFDANKNLVVLTIGRYMKYLHAELRKKKVRTIHFDSRNELSLYLRYVELENSVLLVKGSRGMKMEEFVNILEKRFV